MSPPPDSVERMIKDDEGRFCGARLLRRRGEKEDGRVNVADGSSTAGRGRAARRGKARPGPAGLGRTKAATDARLASAAMHASRTTPRCAAMVGSPVRWRGGGWKDQLVRILSSSLALPLVTMRQPDSMPYARPAFRETCIAVLGC